MKKIVLIITLIIISFQTFPCTSFILRDNNNLYLGKNFDYFTGKGFVFINQRNDIKVGACIPPEKPSQWISKYGNITFNLYGKDLPMSGMNEKGLAVESLWMEDAEYPRQDERQPLPELGWIQYMLDNCATVDEVIEAEQKFRIANTSFAKIHFIVLDALGKSAIVEMIKGETIITRGGSLPIEVIENQTYSQSLDFMQKNPLGLKCYNKPINDKRERFEMVSQLIKDKDPSQNTVDYCFAILNKVTWTTENGDAPTQWSILYNTSTKSIYFKSKDNRNTKVIDFDDFSFKCSNMLLIALIQTDASEFNANNFHNYNLEEAKTYLRNVYEEVPLTKGKLPDQFLNAILDATNKRPCQVIVD